ncbi:MAG: hypothetical protein KatS3mg017_0038 [Fimbriimonadales bacterium]|nr:MAG: hypothetical protein KatS3mg017_0038 [Fimbriimonadales bacterium]
MKRRYPHNATLTTLPVKHTYPPAQPNAEDPTNTPNPSSSPYSCSAPANTPLTDACALPLPVNSSLTIPCLP